MPTVLKYSARWRERQATGKGQAYASALARLANQNLVDADLSIRSLDAAVGGVAVVFAPGAEEEDCDGEG